MTTANTKTGAVPKTAQPSPAIACRTRRNPTLTT